MKVLVTVTTATGGLVDWREQMADARALGEPFALFLTGIGPDERQEAYRMARGSELPFVHARTDMTDDEYRLLMAEFGTRWFNLHPTRYWPLLEPVSDEVRARVLMENTYDLFESDLDGWAGLCLDLSHLEDNRRLDPATYDTIMELAQRFSVVANHLSAVRPSPWTSRKGQVLYSSHHMAGVEEMDYLSRYPARCFGEWAAIELAQPIPDQLRARARVLEVFAGRME